MEHILVEVFVPALEQSFDAFIPLQSPMYEVLELLKKAAREISGGRLVVDETTAICHRDNGRIININMSVYELGVRNGSKLMLI